MTRGSLQLGRLLWDSLRVYFGRLPLFLLLVLIPSAIGALLFVGIAVKILGFSTDGAGMDPTTLAVTLNRDQWVMITAGGFGMAIVSSLAMAASIHVACERERIGVRRAFGMVTAKSMQIFWLQCVIYALAVRFSPFAAPLLWFSLAFGIGVGVREDLGPSDAMERAWSLTQGSRLKVLVLEVLLLVPFIALIAGISYLFLIPGPWFNLNKVEPQTRQLFSGPIMALLLIPIQFMFVALARGYAMLKQAEEPALHAKAASSVSSL